ncbi:MAG: FtsK/SpoIIIE domain-containing protein [Acetobacter sp.]|nr:FtsK/SpoIIIE domain-containing protein [Acetobacter sp.]
MRELTEVLKNYGINGTVVGHTRGSLLEIIEFQPAAGTKLKNIASSVDDIRRELGVSSLRVEAATVGNTILFQIPAENFETIDFKQLLESPEFIAAKENKTLPLIMGTDIKGTPIIADLAKMPHLLIGGTTGSGKSVGLNTFILSLIAAKKPDEIKFVLIDPKKIEFSIYNNQKYLYTPVITETTEAIATLAYLAEEMDKRYALFAENMSKNLTDYNNHAEEKLPYIICIIDEFADLMAMDKDVEKDVMRLAQKARAAGIHLILATQRPSVDIVTGVLKANFPTRLAYKVASSADSRTILDTTGAEDLIGRGDSLFLAADGILTRLHGAYMPDSEITAILQPYQTPIKPLKLEYRAGSSVAIIDKPAEPIHKRAFRFWTGLRQKDKDMIIKIAKYVFAYLAGWWSSRKENKREDKTKG